MFMRVFITSTPGELEPCRRAAMDVARELGYEPVLRAPAGRRGLDPLTALRRQVARADAVLAIVGWQRGPVPPARLGGDGLRPWSYFEVRCAVDKGLPMAAMLAGNGWARQSSEETAEARAVMADLRGELARLGAVFKDEADFRWRVRGELRELEHAPQVAGRASEKLKLRSFPPPELPARPYPLLLPYSHPDHLAGRDEDLEELRRLLARPLTVVGIHAVSGTGKSSLLAGGLVPLLRAEGRPVAFDRHPAEAGLARRLLEDLVESGAEEAGSARLFVDQLVKIRRQSGTPPILVIDQFEDLLKEGARAARAAFGTFLATSAQRLPGLDGSPCRWLLAYRQEYHGQLLRWLEDVLREARGRGFENVEAQPHDLSDASRFASWVLRPLAAPAAEVEDPIGELAAQTFLEVIEKPLRHETYPWYFAPGHAEWLARAFSAARVFQPNAPLVPELQVVLAHLLEKAGEPVDGEPVRVEVPGEVEELIVHALEEHLRRALDQAFPRADVVARSRALLVLRELADVHGRRKAGLADDLLARALGEEGHEVLEKLATARARIVLRERHGDGWVWVLSHDRLAEILVRVVDEGRWGGLDVDADWLALRRLVVLQSRLFEAGDVDQATVVPAADFERIEAHPEVLLWSDSHRAWWEGCRARRRLDQRRRTMRALVTAAVFMAVALGSWTWADQRAQRRALLEEVASGEPEIAFAALVELTAKEGYDPEGILEPLRRREAPFDVFEKGLGGGDEDRRAEALVRVAELAVPILEASPEDPVLIASLVWALDFFARDPPFGERALKLREEVLKPLRQSHPPPPWPEKNDPDWTQIPAGTFWMGAGPEDGRDDPNMKDEFPRHQVTLSAFRILRYEVTNAEYRRLVPDHDPGADDDLPAAFVTWYAAYTYAAWLGGRLPTEAEWEYAARADCAFAYCQRDGSEAMLDDVGSWIGNSTDPVTGNPVVQLGRRLEPNTWGLWDIYGNVWEWTATWYDIYTHTPKLDPTGPTNSALGFRTFRGGSVNIPKEWVAASGRGLNSPELFGHIGIRALISER